MPVNEIFTTSEYHKVYPLGIERHFWNLARNDLIYRRLAPHLKPGDLVMDVGCGTGLVVDDLRSRGLNIRGVELGAAPILPGLETLVDTETDLFDFDESVKKSIKAVLLLDVLEHIADRREFLRKIHLQLPNCQVILITVPARREIWSAYDEHWGHHLRYDRPGLESEARDCGFAPHRTSYFFHWLYLASLLMNALGVAKSVQFQPISPGGFKALLHRVLGLITRVESSLVPGAIPGSSIICVAYRIGDSYTLSAN